MRDYMLDKCPVSTYKDIAEVIQEDLGKTPEELFASIEEVPIASASLAQVQSSCKDTFLNWLAQSVQPKCDFCPTDLHDLANAAS